MPPLRHIDTKFNNQSFKIEPTLINQALPDGAEMGQVTRLTPHAKAGVFIAEIAYGRPSEARKKIVVDLTTTELKALGMRFDAQGNPVTSALTVQIWPGQVGESQAAPTGAPTVVDPREGPVEYSVKKTDYLRNTEGNPIGEIKMIAGGQEGEHHMTFADGSQASAKTTKGARSYQEDGTYLGKFKLPNGTEVKVIAGADGAGGMGGGDVASSSWLQGINAQAAKATAEGRVPTADELFKAGMMALAEQKKHAGPRAKEATGAGGVVVIVGDQAMIATAGDAMVAFSRRKPNGDYETTGYSHIDNMGSGVLVNAISANTPQLYV
ncbi:MAG TPA: hypothetical protein VFW62_02660, partial [bacterium]|nr:hypothetical protein [bacterium]